MYVMKKQVIFILFVLLSLSGFSQKIGQNTLTLKNTKELKKAIKSSGYLDAGFYWNESRTELNKILLFTPKKSDDLMLQIHSINEKGEVLNTEVKPLTDEVLAEYDLNPANFSEEQAKKELAGFKTAYIKNPGLAGEPKLVFGEFVDRFHSSGVWVGFKFEPSNKIELDERFWSFVSFPVEGEVLDRNYHLLAAPGNLGKLFTGFGYRQYLDASQNCYIGGLMATEGQNEFLSGVYNLSKKEWINKTKIDLGMKILPGQNSFERLENGNTVIIIAGKDQYKCLIVDPLGNKVSLSDLAVKKSGGTSNLQIAPVVKRISADQIAVATSSYETLGGKEVGIGFTLIENDEVKNSWNYSNEDLISKLQLPAKHKIKVQKLKYLRLESIQSMGDGSYLVVGFVTQDKINSTGRAQVVIHISKEGQLVSCYMMESLTPPKEEQLGEKIPSVLVPTKDGFYWVERSEVIGYEKGVYSFTEEFKTFTRTTTYRQEETMTIGQISKVNVTTGEISNTIRPKGFILGDRISVVSKNGTLVINTEEGLMFIQ